MRQRQNKQGKTRQVETKSKSILKWDRFGKVQIAMRQTREKRIGEGHGSLK